MIPPPSRSLPATAGLALLLLAPLLLGPAAAFVGSSARLPQQRQLRQQQQRRSMAVSMSTTEPKPPTVPKVGAPMPEGTCERFGRMNECDCVMKALALNNSIQHSPPPYMDRPLIGLGILRSKIGQGGGPTGSTCRRLGAPTRAFKSCRSVNGLKPANQPVCLVTMPVTHRSRPHIHSLCPFLRLLFRPGTRLPTLLPSPSLHQQTHTHRSRCGSWTCTLCARRRSAPTSGSAGTAARAPSCSSATRARGAFPPHPLSQQAPFPFQMTPKEEEEEEEEQTDRGFLPYLPHTHNDVHAYDPTQRLQVLRRKNFAGASARRPLRATQDRRYVRCLLFGAARRRSCTLSFEHSSPNTLVAAPLSER